MQDRIPHNFRNVVPKLRVGPDAIPPALGLVIAALSRREGKPIEVWVNERLRCAILETVGGTERQALLRDLTSYGKTLPVRDDAGSDADTPTPDLPSLGNYWELARQLADEISAAVDAIPSESQSLLDARRVPARRRHPFLVSKVDVPKWAEKDEPEKMRWFERLRQSGPEREIPVVTKATIDRLSRLRDEAPHLSDATDFVLGQLQLSRIGDGRFSLPPMLLVGDPGVGKSWWCEQLALALGVGYEALQMPSVTASFELTGSNHSWNNAKPGRFLRAFLSTESASPIFVLDELDRMNVGNYAPEGTLLGLLDTQTSRRFRDEFYDAEFDLSRSVFVATANHPEHMDQALRSRFEPIVVRAPVGAECLAVVNAIWQALRLEWHKGRGLRLAPALPGAVLDVLGAHFESPRRMQKLLQGAAGEAAKRGRPVAVTELDVMRVLRRWKKN